MPDVFTQAFVIEKDSKRFPESGGWGYALFNYDAKSDTFTADGATSDDVLKLMDIVRSRVAERMGVELETEIEIW